MDEFVERMKKRRMILNAIKNRNDSTNELLEKCDNLICLIDETILVHCSIYN